MPLNDDFDPMATRREAAMFYGLFLRGHSADDIRKDIAISKETLKKWQSHYGKDGFWEKLQQIYEYRRQVLAIFDELVTNERARPRLQ
jgi:transposase